MQSSGRLIAHYKRFRLLKPRVPLLENSSPCMQASSAFFALSSGDWGFVNRKKKKKKNDDILVPSKAATNKIFFVYDPVV